jgi:hypothetical protein
MVEGRKPPVKRLSKDAQELVYTRLIAGASNAETRQVLHDAGHPSDLDAAAFYYYRKTKRVRDAIALTAHEEYQTGYGLPMRRIALCKEMLADSLRQIRAGVILTRTVPAEVDAEGKVLTPSREEAVRADLKSSDYQRLVSSVFQAFDRLTKMIDGPEGLYADMILPTLVAEEEAEKAAKTKTKKGHPADPWTKTQKLAFFNDMLESAMRDGRHLEANGLLPAENLAYPHLRPSYAIPAGPADDLDFGDDEEMD